MTESRVETRVGGIGSQGLLVFFCGCLFLSGATGLIYELAWTRYLNLIFGSTTYSITTVISAYMLGLGVGSLILGRVVDRIGRPGVTYAALEGLIGLYALASPAIFALIDHAYVGVHRMLEPPLFWGALIKFAFSFGAMLIPTILMGGTLPVLAKMFVRDRGDTQRIVGYLYGLNTLGAVTGTFLFGFVLCEVLGISTSIYLSACVNLLIAVMAFTLVRRMGERRAPAAVPAASVTEGAVLAEAAAPSPPSSPQRAGDALRLRFALFGFLLSGFTALLYEVVWVRVWLLVIGNSTYAFSLILINMLLGIGLGSFLFSRLFKNRPARLLHFAMAQALIGLLAFLFIPYIEKLAVGVTAILQIKFLTHTQFLLFEGLATALIILPVSVVFGATMPIIANVVVRHLKSLGRDVGNIYFLNTVGSILGSFLTGFFLIHWLGSVVTLKIGIGLNLLLALAAVILARRGAGGVFLRVAAVGLAGAVAVLTLASGGWPHGIFNRGYSIYSGRNTITTKDELIRFLNDSNYYDLYFKEGLDGTISVRTDGYLTKLVINGKVDGSNDLGDMVTQYGSAWLPLALKPRPQKAVVIGAGTGTTARVLAECPTMQRVEVVEIEEAVIEAGKHFDPINNNVYANPKVELFINDGRSHLLVQEGGYDLIVSEPSNPWIAGIASLFTEDFFRIVESRLAPNGLLCQWLQFYQLSEEATVRIFKTFKSVFPHMQVYCTAYDLLLIGSRERLVIDPQWVAELYAMAPNDWEVETYTGIREPVDILGMYLAGPESIEAMLDPDLALHRDDHPRLEFEAARGLFRDEHPMIKKILQLKHDCRDFVPAGLEAAAREQSPLYILARANERRGWLDIAMVDLEAALRLEPENPKYNALHGKLLVKSNPSAGGKVLENTLKRHPDMPEAALYMGLLAIDMGRPAQVAPLIPIAARVQPLPLDFHLMCISYYTFARQDDRAFEHVIAVLQALDRPYSVAPDIAKVFPIVAEYGTRTADQDRFLAAIIEHAQKHPHFLWLKFLGRVHFERGDMRRAAEFYQRVADVYAADEEDLIRLAHCYARLGDMDKARETIALARKMFPNSREARELEASWSS